MATDGLQTVAFSLLRSEYKAEWKTTVEDCQQYQEYLSPVAQCQSVSTGSANRS